ncbi:hypothetical protein FRB97_009285 [Tulasnella sp. 331]|nr:hypothetical protein FRB97_009285 [Tulasnella sp. 331]KAG8882739.1 hypothetical protein FRB98_003508 [Tulasnella sp. 332]
MSVSADYLTQTATLSATVACNDTNFPIIMSTTYARDLTTENAAGTLDMFADNIFGGKILSFLSAAGDDLVSNLANAPSVLNNAAPTSLFHLQAFPPRIYCFNERLGAVGPSCSAVPPARSDPTPDLFFSNGTLTTVSDSPAFPTNYSGAVSNALQLLLTAARLDMGNIFPNNILVYANALNATIASELPVQGAPSTLETEPSLYIQLQNVFNDSPQASSTGVLEDVLDPSQPAVIASQYLCRFSQAKPLGEAFVSVLVATLSMFSSGWATFLLISTYFEKRRYHGANLCDGHTDLEGSHNIGPRDESGATIPLVESRYMDHIDEQGLDSS